MYGDPRMRHTHPITIAANMSMFLFLLIIPLVRGFLNAIQNDFYAWLHGTWYDIMVLLVIASLGFLRWWFCLYSFENDRIKVRTGVWIRHEYDFSPTALSSLSVVYKYYLKPFHAVYLRADTPGGSMKRPDLSLIISRREAQRILDLRAGQIINGQYIKREYRPRGIYIAALSAITSNSFAGILFLATLISQSGTLLGQEFSDRLVGTFENLTRLLAFGLPPAAAALAYLILGGWGVMFLLNLLKHKNFTVKRGANFLFVRSGVLTNRRYSLNIDQINYVDIRQSVLTKIFRYYSVFINTAGYGKQKDDISTIIPAASKEELQFNMRILLPEFIRTKRTLKPNAGAIFKFILEPLWPCVLIPVATYLLIRLFPSWADFIRYFGLMACVPAFWFLTVRLFDYFTSGISREGDYFTLRYSHGFYLHTVVIPRDKIASVCLRQSILQRMDDKCDVLVLTRNERYKKHHVKNLDRLACIDLFGLQDQIL